MGKFGWSYPAGCDGPPDDNPPMPSELCENVLLLLEKAGTDQRLCDLICHLIDGDIKVSKAIDDVISERERQKQLAFGGDTESFDKTNTRNDWVAYGIAYLGRASDKVFRNDREKCDYRENLVKSAAVIIAAIEANDNGYS